MILSLSANLRLFSRLYNQALIKAVPQLNLIHDADLLLLLDSSETILMQKEIAETLLFDKSRVAVLIEGLRTKELIYTERNPADRREHFVYLTSKGKEAVNQINSAIAQVDNVMNNQLDKAHLDHFYATLSKMQFNLAAVSL